MTFLQPFILFGLPLILLPVIIHLINRMRHRPQQWAAMRFLISATRASTSHAKLRQFLILLFRTLAVLMLLIFLARPLAGGWMGWMLSPAPDVVLILLDRSASMEARVGGETSKREQALKLIADAARQFEGSSHLVLIDSALRTPQELVNAGALQSPSLTGPTDTAADIPAMLQAAHNYLVENRAGSAEIWIASDLQRSNWQPDDTRFKNAISQLSGLPQRVRVRLLALNQPAENNLSIAIQDTARRMKGDQSELQFVVDLQGTGENKDNF
ncbi:MAG: BatA domain-containing protein, partial [Limisphaerales bacterium]